MSNLLSIQPCRRNLAKEVELKLDGRQYLYRVGPMRHVHCGYNDSWTREMRSGEVIPKEHNGDYLYLTHSVYEHEFIVCCENHKQLFLDAGWIIC